MFGHCGTKLNQTKPYPIMPYHTLLYPTIPYYTLTYSTIPYQVHFDHNHYFPGGGVGVVLIRTKDISV